jgi:hypothetical protein
MFVKLRRSEIKFPSIMDDSGILKANFLNSFMDYLVRKTIINSKNQKDDTESIAIRLCQLKIDFIY